jgi:hypothetical protein
MEDLHMSAYIVSEKVINVIVNLIAGEGGIDNDRHYGNIRMGNLCHVAASDGLISSQEFPTSTRDQWDYVERMTFISLLGRALWGMNINAVSQRYSDCVHATSVDDEGKCTATGKHQLPGPVPNPNPHDYAFKAIPLINKKIAIGSAYSEFNYQCCEGNVPGTDFFKALESMIGGMAVDIIKEEFRSQLGKTPGWGTDDCEESPVQIKAGM